MEDKETLELQIGGATSDMDEEKTESLGKEEDVTKSKPASEGYLSDKTTTGDLSEKLKEESPSHKSDNTAIPDLDNAAAKFAETPQPTADDYIQGFKGKIILSAVTGACFIMLLDIAIIATVNLQHPWVNFNISNATTNRQSLV
jgi:hypothetical protein